MANPVSILNLGLGKIGSSRVSNITPPRSNLERHCAEGYPQWRDSELSRRRWVFANRWATLTQTGTQPTVPLDGRIYRFALPNDILKPIRQKDSEWIQRGVFLYSSSATLDIEYTARVPEGEFDALFVDVLAARVAKECVEYATQSNTKTVATGQDYDEAVSIAKQANALVIGSEDYDTLDEHDSWLQARLDPGFDV